MVTATHGGLYVSHLRRFGLVVLLLFSTAWPVSAEEILRYAGATTLQRYFMPEAARLFNDETAVRIRIEGGNTDPGIKALLNGEIDMAGSGRLLTAHEKQKGLVEHFLGWDVLAVVLHKQNPVEELNFEQLHGIFSGRLTNWQQVGGIDAPILVVTSPKGSGMRTAVKDLILQGREFLPREVVSAIVAEADQQVGMFPNAITVQSRSMLDAKTVKTIRVAGVEPSAANVAAGRYLLAKPLALITLGQPQGDLARFLALVKSPRGKVILKKYFVAAE